MQTRIEYTRAVEADVENVRFAHGKRLEGLHDLGIFTLRDLLGHYPFRYDDFSQVVNIVDITLGEKTAVLGTIHEAKARKTAHGGHLYQITVTDSTGVIKAAWFNQRWLANTLTVGKRILLLGKAEHYNGFMNMTSPLYTLVFGEEPALGEASRSDQHLQQVNSGPAPLGIVPVYRANSSMSSNWIKRLVLEAFKLAREPLDPLPPELRIKRSLMSRQMAWQSIHAPVSAENLAEAHKRLAYEQIFWLLMGSLQKQAMQNKRHASYGHKVTEPLTKKLAQLLPFELTDSQHEAIQEISHDMQASGRMNRLVLGDVGSGKTVVATCALVAAAENGWQSVMMAPTEVLVHQYAQSVGPLLDKLGVSWVLLSSALGSKERKQVYERLKNGSAQVAFGTHALIEPEVAFKELSLIVIDEQHRFGVEHRNRLIAKSPAADFLSMTATPIPRSLALVLYGTLKVSYLKNRPKRATTTTLNLERSVSYKAYDAVREALSRGEQAYIVCPLISVPVQQGNEEEHYLDNLDDFVDEPSLAAAEAELEHLRQKVFPERRIELLTSRVKSEDKQRIMNMFRSGEIDILVSTTVIEVGVDVPNATVMIILNADRFGLAQLHQLRGRVGRGVRDAQVFLISQNPGESARRRLRLLEDNNDGLTLAEADLAERREGDIAGIRQHGESALSLINVMRDGMLIEAAHADVTHLLEQDPELALSKHQHLRYELTHLTEQRHN